MQEKYIFLSKLPLPNITKQMSKHYACPIECTLLQLFRLIDIISLIVIAVINSFHVHIPVINQIRQHISQKGWAIFISTYFSTISSKLDWGIFSICSTDDSRYITGARRGGLCYCNYTIFKANIKLAFMKNEKNPLPQTQPLFQFLQQRLMVVVL